MRRSSKPFASRCTCRKISSTLSVLVRRRSCRRWWIKLPRINTWRLISMSFATPAICRSRSTLIRQSARLAWMSSSWCWRPRVASTATSIASTPTTWWNTSRACRIRFRLPRSVETTAKMRCRKLRLTAPRRRWTRSTRPAWIWRRRCNRQSRRFVRSVQRRDRRVRTPFPSRKSSAPPCTSSKSRTQFFRGKTSTCHRPSCSTTTSRMDRAIRTTTLRPEID